jgi:hypothetical protein
VTHQGQSLGRLGVDLGGRHAVALGQRQDVLEQCRQVAAAAPDVAEQIGAPGDPLLGQQIEQQERRLIDRDHAGHQGPPQRNDQRAQREVADGQLGSCHDSFELLRSWAMYPSKTRERHAARLSNSFGRGHIDLQTLAGGVPT